MSELKKLTRLGADTRKIAALLQAKAPPGEMLAYINPQEAALLKSRGGSGKPHADTGIPSFQMEEGSDFPEAYMGETYTTPVSMGGGDVAATPSAYDLAPGAPISAAPPVIAAPPVSGPSPLDAQLGQFPLGVTQRAAFETPAAPAAPNISGRLAEALGMREDTLGKLGLGGLQALVGGRQARQAAAQGRQGVAEQQAIAQPYQQLGRQLQSQAQRGELTPQAQQSLQAVQAQTAQAVQRAGGVGAQQAAAQVEAVRQQLLQSQFDYGLKLSGIGDQIALGAIRAGIQADRYVNELTGSYFQNIMRTVTGSQAPAQPQGVQR